MTLDPGLGGCLAGKAGDLRRVAAAGNGHLDGEGTIGYYQVSSNGNVAHFGDATFQGDPAGAPLNHPIVGIAGDGDNAGYWLVASDGGIFTFGDASFYGSAGGVALDQPAVAIS